MDDMQNMAILYGVPKVAYGTEGVTPLPLALRACAEYLGEDADYARIISESGAAFRLAWDTSCWNGGNVDSIFTFDDPVRVFVCGLRAIGRDLRMLARTPETEKEDFIAFIRAEIDAGNPVIALGVIGPPEAGVIAGYRDGGNTLMGWNVFQEYPENQSRVRFMENGYYITDAWWENPDTRALFATGERSSGPLAPAEVMRSAAEALEGRICGTCAKGLMAYDAWKSALLKERDFPRGAIIPVLVERLMCHGDAMDCLTDGRWNAAKYLRSLAARYPGHAAKLLAATAEFEALVRIISKEMMPVLGGWERGEIQMRALAEPETRRLFAALIDRMKAHDARALGYIRELAEDMKTE